MIASVHLNVFADLEWQFRPSVNIEFTFSLSFVLYRCILFLKRLHIALLDFLVWLNNMFDEITFFA